MFLGTSILKAFWEDFGRVLGGPNPRFSHFFRCFFEVNFEVRFGRAKNRPRSPKRSERGKIWTWIPVVPRLLGRDYREGYSKSRTFLCYFIFRFENLKTLDPARRCHTFGGRRNVAPLGGPPPPTFFCPGHWDRIGLRDRTRGFALRTCLAFLAYL